jgi:hypothetical protein
MRDSRLRKLFPFNDLDWSPEWPTEKDTLWWAYGYPHGVIRDAFDTHDPELILVQVVHDGNGNPMYVGDGTFIYKQEAKGLIWKRVTGLTLPPNFIPSI